MAMNLTIGSGDITALMAGNHTKAYQDLWRKFTADGKPYYNALASPIDALRAGAILEDRYLLTLPNDYFIQHKVTSKEMDVFTSSLDFARIEKGIVSDFDELKTIYFPDFIDKIEPYRNASPSDCISMIKKEFKKYYQQVQIQLYCSGLSSAYLVFLSVMSYDDDENNARIIQPNEYIKFRIYRDEEVISSITNRGLIFQKVKDNFKK